MKLLYAIASLPLWLVKSQNVAGSPADDKASIAAIDEGTKLTFGLGLGLDFCAPDDDSAMGQVIAAKKKFWAWKMGLFGYDVYSHCSSGSDSGMTILPGSSTSIQTNYVTQTVNPAVTIDWVTEPGEVITAYYTPTPVVTTTFQYGTNTITEAFTSTGSPIPYTTTYVVSTDDY